MKIVIPLSIFIFFLVGAYSLYHLTIGWGSADIDETIEMGNRVVILLEDYKETYGYYPKVLEDMATVATEKLLPKVGTKFWMYNGNSNDFYLGVGGENEDTDPVLYRTSKSEEWYMDTR